MRKSPAVKRELPPDSSSGARSSTSTRFAVSFAEIAAHKAALPPPTTTTSYSSLTDPRSSCRTPNDTSIRLNPGSPDDLAPLLDLFVEELRKRFRPERIDHGAEGGKLLPDSRVLESLQRVGAEPCDRLLRRLGWRKQAPPDVRVVARNAGLGEGRNVGKQGKPLRAPDGEGAQAPRLDVRHDLERVGDEEGEAPAQEVGDRGSAALIRHMHHVDPGLEAQQLRREVLRAAVAGRAVVERSGLGLRERDQLLHRLRRELRRHDEHQRRIADARHRSEIDASIE